MIRGKRVHYLHTERLEKSNLTLYIKKQFFGVISLIICLVLSIPGVPGPGILFFALALLLLDYPGKDRLFLYLREKRYFRIVRVLLWKKLNIFLVLPTANGGEGETL